MELYEIECTKCHWTKEVTKEDAQGYHHHGCPICQSKQSMNFSAKQKRRFQEEHMRIAMDGLIQTSGIERAMEVIERAQDITQSEKNFYVRIWNERFASKGLAIKISTQKKEEK